MCAQAVQVENLSTLCAAEKTREMTEQQAKLDQTKRRMSYPISTFSYQARRNRSRSQNSNCEIGWHDYFSTVPLNLPNKQSLPLKSEERGSMRGPHLLCQQVKRLSVALAVSILA